MQKFKNLFQDVPDPRADNARHDLVDVLVIALAAVLCGADNCADMAECGCAKEALLRQFLRLEHGIPSHDTFSRIFRLLDPQAFEPVFRRFLAEFAKERHGVVAVDGKALRGAFERGRKTTPLQLVNVWAAEARLAIAQRLAPKRNEVAAALEALELLALDGCTATPSLPSAFSTVADNTLWRSRPTNRRCLPTRRYCWSRWQNIRRYSNLLPAAMAETNGAKRWSCLRQDSRASTTSLESKRSHVSSCSAGSAMPRSHQLFDTSCCRDGGRQRACWQSPAPIGVSRTSCTGSSTSSSTKTAPATARTTDRRTSPFCASWHSILSARIRAPRPYAAKSNAQGGTMPSSPICSPKCDSPA